MPIADATDSSLVCARNTYDVKRSDEDSVSDGGCDGRCDARGRNAEQAQHERCVLEKLDRFMRRDDESGDRGNGAGGGAGQPQSSAHIVAAPAGDDDDDWVTV